MVIKLWTNEHDDGIGLFFYFVDKLNRKWVTSYCRAYRKKYAPQEMCSRNHHETFSCCHCCNANLKLNDVLRFWSNLYFEHNSEAWQHMHEMAKITIWSSQLTLFNWLHYLSQEEGMRFIRSQMGCQIAIWAILC